MEGELLIKIVTAVVAIVGSLLGCLHYFATRRAAGYQNSKIEMELLSQSITAHDTEPDYKAFLVDVRKEKISSLVFGVPIPNADIPRVIAYYKEAAGKVTTGEIAKAWRYRDPNTEHLSFQLHGAFKVEFRVALGFVLFCVLALLVGVVSLFVYNVQAKQAFLLIGVSVIGLVEMIWINQEIFMAARLGEWEKQRHCKVAP